MHTAIQMATKVICKKVPKNNGISMTYKTKLIFQDFWRSKENLQYVLKGDFIFLFELVVNKSLKFKLLLELKLGVPFIG